MANKLVTSAMYEKAKLEHYGVKGMKWGVRRTPEQLGRKTKSKKQSEKPEEFNGLVELVTVLAFVTLTTAGYAAANVGTKKIMTEAEKPELQLNKLRDAKKINPPESYRESLRETNNTKSPNRNFKNNCPNTTLAYELRRRGYDVKAKPSPRGSTMTTIKELYNIKKVDLKISDMADPSKIKENNQKMNSYFDSMPDGYRGAIGLSWDGGIGGHIFNVERVNGKTIFIDSQSGKSGEFTGASLMTKKAQIAVEQASYGLLRNKNPAHYLSRARDVEIFRTDNATINETKLSDRVLKG